MTDGRMRNALRGKIIMAAACAMFAFSCEWNNGAEARKTDPVPLPVNEQVNEAALFLAGKPLPAESGLESFSKGQFYSSYRAQMDAGWKKFQKPNLDKIAEWWKDRRFATRTKAVLYPFSGPDIINALTFYPDADLYIMFGLEQPGTAPTPTQMNEKQLVTGLNALKQSMNTIFHVNFFKTNGMAHQLGNYSFNSITGILMFFLAINDFTITEVKRIAVDSNSQIVDGKASDNAMRISTLPRSYVPGVEISFTKDRKRLQRLRFFQINIANDALAKRSPNFIPYLEKEAPFSTLIKSASYLMHYDDRYSKIREAILKTSSCIIQDDSGIPLKHFKASEWKLGFHGYYDRPIRVFRSRYQKEFREAMNQKTTGRLPFSYGYDYQPGRSNLLTAERAVKTEGNKR